MPGEMIPEEYSSRIESVGGYSVAITSYRLGNRYFAKVEIRLPGAEARIADSEALTKAAAEETVLSEARRLIGSGR